MLENGSQLCKVKLITFDFDETLTLMTYLIEDGDSEDVQSPAYSSSSSDGSKVVQTWRKTPQNVHETAQNGRFQAFRGRFGPVLGGLHAELSSF